MSEKYTVYKVTLSEKSLKQLRAIALMNDSLIEDELEKIIDEYYEKLKKLKDF